MFNFGVACWLNSSCSVDASGTNCLEKQAGSRITSMISSSQKEKEQKPELKKRFWQFAPLMIILVLTAHTDRKELCTGDSFITAFESEYLFHCQDTTDGSQFYSHSHHIDPKTSTVSWKVPNTCKYSTDRGHYRIVILIGSLLHTSTKEKEGIHGL